MLRTAMLLLLCPSMLLASDDAALALADATADRAATSPNRRLLLELAQQQQQGLPSGRRLSLGLAGEQALPAGLRLVFDSRLDWRWPQPAGEPSGITTVKDAYLSYAARPALWLDVGRIAVRQGVAAGFNPSDFFGRDSLRSISSLDPASLRENRQGSVMLRGQFFGDDGALAVHFSPALDQQANPAGRVSDSGAVNRDERWLLTLSPRSNGSPHISLYHEQGQAWQGAISLSTVAGHANVLYAEWAGGKQTATRLGPSGWRNRFAGGLRHTTASKLTAQLEWQYDGRLPTRGGLAMPDQTRVAQSLQAALRAGRLGSRQAAMLWLQQEDAGLHGLDLSLMVNRDLDRRASRIWGEARYGFGNQEISLQVWKQRGRHGSLYGLLPAYGSQLGWRHFF